jgi:hypothetical protein
MKKPKVIKIFGHYKLINENGEILWSENNMDGHNISQQRKLLLAFWDHINSNCMLEIITNDGEYVVDDFLKANNIL